MPLLGVNIDHVATLRQARRESDPDPIVAAQMCERSGAKSIVAHLREDRRHIQDRDIFILRKVVKTKFNLELSVSPAIVNIACQLIPNQATLVPERRQEITTEGGLDVVKNFKKTLSAADKLRAKGITVSLFIDPNKKQLDAAKAMEVRMIEFHTGSYARAFANRQAKGHLEQLIKMTAYANKLGITVNLGHGLNYENTYAVARIPGVYELNIGHSIISRAIFVGLNRAVKDMLTIIKNK